MTKYLFVKCFDGDFLELMAVFSRYNVFLLRVANLKESLLPIIAYIVSTITGCPSFFTLILRNKAENLIENGRMFGLL